MPGNPPASGLARMATRSHSGTGAARHARIGDGPSNRCKNPVDAERETVLEG